MRIIVVLSVLLAGALAGAQQPYCPTCPGGVCPPGFSPNYGAPAYSQPIYNSYQWQPSYSQPMYSGYQLQGQPRVYEWREQPYYGGYQFEHQFQPQQYGFSGRIDMRWSGVGGGCFGSNGMPAGMRYLGTAPDGLPIYGR